MPRLIKNSLLSLILLLFFIPGKSQELDHVLGDILIQMEKDKSPSRLASELSFFEGEPTLLTFKQVTVEPMNIWLLQFDYNAINENSLLLELQNKNEILVAQKNHLIKKRLEPNDVLFTQQWQYINDGSFGTEDADIDMELAWDITTGGVTANGDTIVACVVDDGLDGSHFDFEDNLWVNRAEIPNNNIDDDNNGYVDDYDGWDAYTNTGNIFVGGGHGTPVAGIVGAKGNNGIGVSGVNWDVKLMIVRGGGDEAQALAAYAYPYTFRKKYNETNGAEGAFVVVTNSSWGINFGQPDQSPLWCSFYDSLGIQGILNCGATINGNFDVDEIGDLPTGCDSDFLLSVTNMNSSDNKVAEAGYGKNTIDLGAFGQDTYTTAFGNNYGGFGGTSGATPHVAGAIALAYSVQCQQLADLSLQEPAAAAHLIKLMILDGVDPNASLEGITVTGGRLNVHTTLIMVESFCSACPPPFGIEVPLLTDVQSLVSWTVPDSASGFNLRYREVGAEDWDTLSNVTSPTVLNDLLACTEYELQMQSICQDTISDFGFSFNFQTLGCCELPEMFEITVGDSLATAKWNNKLAAVTYILEYKDADSTEWIGIETVDVEVILDQIPLCAIYEARLNMVCNSGDTLTSDIVTFSAGCGICTATAYCENVNLDAFSVWLDTLIIGEESNVSGNNDGYGDFTGRVNFNVRQDARFDVRLVQQYGPFEPPVDFAIWIDYNQNFEFEEEELAFSTDMPSFGGVDGFIEIPQEAIVGYTRMRVAVRPFELPSACPDPDYVRGEIEDYCIWIGEEVFPCDLGFDLMIEDIEMTGARLVWSPLDSAIAYNIRYKALEDEYSDFSAIDTFYDLSGLEKCTEYIAEVRAVCAHDTSAYNVVEFKTQCSTSTLDELAGLNDLNVYPNPFQADVLLDFELEKAMDLKLELYDISGKMIYNQMHTNLISGNNAIEVGNLQDLTNGLYLLRIQSENGQVVRKLVKS